MDLEQLTARALAWLGLDVGATGADVDAAPGVAAAVAAFVDDLPDIDPDEWSARTAQGAVTLTARLIRRRNSPEGVTAFTQESAVYVARNDPDIALMLRLDRHKRPRIG